MKKKKKTNSSRYLQHYNKAKIQLISLLLKGVPPSPFLQLCSFVELTVKADRNSLMHEEQTRLPQGKEDHSLCSSLCNSREGKSAPADGGLSCKRGTLFQSCRKESLLHAGKKGSESSAELRAGPKSPQTLIEKMIDSALFCFFQQNIAGCFLCCSPPSLLHLFAKSWGCQTNTNSP